MNHILHRLGIRLPIIQAPMAGISTPALAAAVSNTGGLGSIAIGATDADTANATITTLRAATNQPFNVNLFCHPPAQHDPVREQAWLTRLTPEFERFGASPPRRLREIYRSFISDDATLAILLRQRPAVVSFHFGLPDASRIAALHAAGITLLASVTSLAEGHLAATAGIDLIIAQGFEAGGHRGMFDPALPDDRLTTFTLTRLLAQNLSTPIIAAGGIMDGAGIAAALRLGAVAAQLGTAFIACPESAADDAFRTALMSPAAHHTTMTSAISGRPARGLANRFTVLGETDGVPAYPIAYDAGKALNAAARAAGETGFGAHWAGQGAPLARALPAAALMAELEAEVLGVTRTRASHDAQTHQRLSL